MYKEAVGEEARGSQTSVSAFDVRRLLDDAAYGVEICGGGGFGRRRFIPLDFTSTLAESTRGSCLASALAAGTSDDETATGWAKCVAVKPLDFSDLQCLVGFSVTCLEITSAKITAKRFGKTLVRDFKDGFMLGMVRSNAKFAFTFWNCNCF